MSVKSIEVSNLERVAVRDERLNQHVAIKQSNIVRLIRFLLDGGRCGLYHAVPRGCGGIGRRTSFRYWRVTSWRFKSSHPHHILYELCSKKQSNPCRLRVWLFFYGRRLAGNLGIFGYIPVCFSTMVPHADQRVIECQLAYIKQHKVHGELTLLSRKYGNLRRSV